MMRFVAWGAVAVVVAAGCWSMAQGADAEVPAVWQMKMKSLTGKAVDMSQYAGKVVLVVNVASKCGYTPQYAGLQQLHERYKDRGLVVLGVPCNQFGGQEPGTEADIAKFCQANYGVTFDMLAKVDVKGEGQCELFKHLTSKETNPKSAGPVKWNFEKFLIGRDGSIVGRYGSGVEPSAVQLVGAIEAELAKK